MGLATHRAGAHRSQARRLPERFPVGATYVVEGFGGGNGDLRVIARYVVLPGGQRINVPAELSVPAPRALAFRRRSNAKQSQAKRRAGDALKGAPKKAGGSLKKIAARRGTG
jgi:hypothetical protein